MAVLQERLCYKMAEKPTLRDNIRRIEEALKSFAGEGTYAHVFDSSPGYLRAIVVSVRFRKQEASTRQNELWQHLKDRLDPGELVPLVGVYPYTWEEYEREFEQSSSGPCPTEHLRESKATRVEKDVEG